VRCAAADSNEGPDDNRLGSVQDNLGVVADTGFIHEKLVSYSTKTGPNCFALLPSAQAPTQDTSNILKRAADMIGSTKDQVIKTDIACRLLMDIAEQGAGPTPRLIKRLDLVNSIFDTTIGVLATLQHNYISPEGELNSTEAETFCRVFKCIDIATKTRNVGAGSVLLSLSKLIVYKNAEKKSTNSPKLNDSSRAILELMIKYRELISSGDVSSDSRLQFASEYFHRTSKDGPTALESLDDDEWVYITRVCDELIEVENAIDQAYASMPTKISAADARDLGVSEDFQEGIDGLYNKYTNRVLKDAWKPMAAITLICALTSPRITYRGMQMQHEINAMPGPLDFDNAYAVVKQYAQKYYHKIVALIHCQLLDSFDIPTEAPEHYEKRYEAVHEFALNGKFSEKTGNEASVNLAGLNADIAISLEKFKESIGQPHVSHLELWDMAQKIRVQFAHIPSIERGGLRSTSNSPTPISDVDVSPEPQPQPEPEPQPEPQPTPSPAKVKRSSRKNLPAALEDCTVSELKSQFDDSFNSPDGLFKAVLAAAALHGMIQSKKGKTDVQDTTAKLEAMKCLMLEKTHALELSAAYAEKRPVELTAEQQRMTLAQLTILWRHVCTKSSKASPKQASFDAIVNGGYLPLTAEHKTLMNEAEGCIQNRTSADEDMDRFADDPHPSIGSPKGKSPIVLAAWTLCNLPTQTADTIAEYTHQGRLLQDDALENLKPEKSPVAITSSLSITSAMQFRGLFSVVGSLKNIKAIHLALEVLCIENGAIKKTDFFEVLRRGTTDGSKSQVDKQAVREFSWFFFDRIASNFLGRPDFTKHPNRSTDLDTAEPPDFLGSKESRIYKKGLSICNDLLTACLVEASGNFYVIHDQYGSGNPIDFTAQVKGFNKDVALVVGLLSTVRESPGKRKQARRSDTRTQMLGQEVYGDEDCEDEDYKVGASEEPKLTRGFADRKRRKTPAKNKASKPKPKRGSTKKRKLAPRSHKSAEMVASSDDSEPDNDEVAASPGKRRRTDADSDPDPIGLDSDPDVDSDQDSDSEEEDTTHSFQALLEMAHTRAYNILDNTRITPTGDGAVPAEEVHGDPNVLFRKSVDLELVVVDTMQLAAELEAPLEAALRHVFKAIMTMAFFTFGADNTTFNPDTKCIVISQTPGHSTPLISMLRTSPEHTLDEAMELTRVWYNALIEAAIQNAGPNASDERNAKAKAWRSWTEKCNTWTTAMTHLEELFSETLSCDADQAESTEWLRSCYVDTMQAMILSLSTWGRLSAMKNKNRDPVLWFPSMSPLAVSCSAIVTTDGKYSVVVDVGSREYEALKRLREVNGKARKQTGKQEWEHAKQILFRAIRDKTGSLLPTILETATNARIKHHTGMFSFADIHGATWKEIKASGDYESYDEIRFSTPLKLLYTIKDIFANPELYEDSNPERSSEEELNGLCWCIADQLAYAALWKAMGLPNPSLMFNTFIPNKEAPVKKMHRSLASCLQTCADRFLRSYQTNTVRDIVTATDHTHTYKATDHTDITKITASSHRPDDEAARRKAALASLSVRVYPALLQMCILKAASTGTPTVLIQGVVACEQSNRQVLMAPDGVQVQCVDSPNTLMELLPPSSKLFTTANEDPKAVAFCRDAFLAQEQRAQTAAQELLNLTHGALRRCNGTIEIATIASKFLSENIAFDMLVAPDGEPTPQTPLLAFVLSLVAVAVPILVQGDDDYAKAITAAVTWVFTDIKPTSSAVLLGAFHTAVRQAVTDHDNQADFIIEDDAATATSIDPKSLEVCMWEQLIIMAPKLTGFFHRLWSNLERKGVTVDNTHQLTKAIKSMKALANAGSHDGEDARFLGVFGDLFQQQIYSLTALLDLHALKHAEITDFQLSFDDITEAKQDADDAQAAAKAAWQKAAQPPEGADRIQLVAEATKADQRAEVVCATMNEIAAQQKEEDDIKAYRELVNKRLEASLAEEAKVDISAKPAGRKGGYKFEPLQGYLKGVATGLKDTTSNVRKVALKACDERDSQKFSHVDVLQSDEEDTPSLLQQLLVAAGDPPNEMTTAELRTLLVMMEPNVTITTAKDGLKQLFQNETVSAIVGRDTEKVKKIIKWVAQYSKSTLTRFLNIEMASIDDDDRPTKRLRVDESH
jgi:hypothetical protein